MMDMADSLSSVMCCPHAVMGRPFAVMARLDRAIALSIPLVPVARSSRAMMKRGEKALT